MAVSRTAVLLTLLLLGVCSVYGETQVTSFSPDNSLIQGSVIISVRGCGFRSHSTAVCVFDERYYSPVHIIQSDDLIYCTTPEIPLEDFDTLPHFSTFSVVFDGDEDLTVPVTDSFRFGPSLDSFAPFDGYVLGGSTFHVIGDGFSDFSSVRVFFDGKDCLNPVIHTDNEIICEVPEGEFNQNAIIDVQFDDNPKYFLHFDKTYHYGPVLYGISPACGNFLGGSQVTILGINLDDPTLTLDAPPAGVGPTVEMIYNDGNTRTVINNVELDPEKNLITFRTPSIGIGFGEEVEFAVYFKSVNSKVRITPRDCFHFDCLDGINTSFTYGPVVLSDVTPNNGFLGGGDTVTIRACGLSDFDTSDISILVGGEELCFRPDDAADTLRVTTDGNRDNDFVTCRTDALPCGTDVNSLPVELQFRLSGSPISTQPAGVFTSGPFIDASTLNPTRGPRIGRDLTSISGNNFFFNSGSTSADPGWTVTAHFTAVDDPSLTLNSVPVAVVSNEQLSFLTPVGLFDLDVNVSFSFENTVAGVCGDYPRIDGNPVYHFGPVCTDVTPVNGYFSGNSPVTIIGEGFTESNNLIEDTEVRLCIDRLSDGDGCTFEPHVRDTTFTMADDQITIITPDVRQGVSTPAGGNRVFGDTASVWVHFTQPGADNVEFPRNQLRPGLNVARIQCPATYRFGPKVDSVTPNKGPNGPRGAGSPGQEITISGSFFADPLFDNSLNEVDLGGIKAFNVNTVDDETITAQTIWGNEPLSTSNVRVIFDTCNQTFSDATLKWGPQLDRIVSPNTGAAGGDIFGLVPGGGDTIDIFGSGFTAFDSVVVYIDGTAVAFTIVSDSEIRATTPCRTFGTVATLSIVFGTICDSTDPDFEQTLVASQLLRYTPRIDSISPKSGLTSGATAVTIFGEGFSGYGKYECFFGHYSDQQHYSPSIDGKQLVCQTPINRGEFNTDVTVHVQLSADDDDDSASLSRSVLATIADDDECDQNNGDFFREVTYPGIEDWDMKVIAPETFHYGPVCTGVSETRCPLGGCSSVQSVVGTGFQDCLFSNSDPSARDLSYPWQDCVFQFYQVRLVDPVTGEVTIADLPSSNSTSASGNSDTNLRFVSPAFTGDAIVEVEFSFPSTSSDPTETSQTTITCGIDGATSVSYGPAFTSQSSTFYDSSTSTSYGWGGDSVTINGVGFTDPEIFAGASVECAVGGVPGVVTTIQSTLAVCVVPNGDFDTLGHVTLSWVGGTQDASITAELFHYGPVIRSLSPGRGMVEAATEITISGFAFECCGITSYECAFPAGAEVNDDTAYIGGNSVTCTVPKNEFIDRQINNVGVKFSSPQFDTPDFTFSETFTEQETALRFYYGPIVNDVYFEDLPTLSGRDQFVIIEGEGFDDPYLIEAFCDFFDIAGNGVNNIPFEPLERTAQTATTLRCPVLEYSHNCNAQDVVRPRWRRGLIEEYQPEQVQNYWKTVAPVLADEDVEPFFSNAGSMEAEFYGPLVYGPNILSVCSGSLCGDDLPVSPIEGGLEITITFDSLRDFVGVEPGSVGSETAFCVFGSRRALSPSPIVADPNVDGQTTITCTTPPGAVDMTGDISVILSPNMNADTNIVDGFFWLPTASGLSRNFGFPEGHETIVVYGSGFCNYESVYCLFDNFEGIQGDITSDREVTCETPLHAPGEVTVSLRFCNADDSCDCTNFGTEDIVTVPETFTYVGVTNVVPSEGPICGGTNVTYSGFGFQFFDSFVCTQGGSTAPAVASDANGILCTTPDISSRFVGQNAESVECLNTQISGFSVGQSRSIFNPFKFEFGVPELISVMPASVDIDDVESTVLTVRGEYINGESFDPETLVCVFDETIVVPAVLVDTIDALKVIQCQAPVVDAIGRYDLTVRYSCGGVVAELFTTNRIPFSITQSPVVENVRPSFSPEIGGVTVTVEGENFNGNGLVLCAFGVLGSGDEKIVGSLGFDDNGSILCKTPAFSVTRNLDLPMSVSLDGGAVWQIATNDFLIEDIVAADDDEC